MKSLYPYLDTIANTQKYTPSFVKKLLRGETVLCSICIEYNIHKCSRS